MAYTSQLNATPGSYTANAYITVTECDSILGKRAGCSGWANFGTGLSTDDKLELKERLIMTASKQIDNAANWAGNKLFYKSFNRLIYPKIGQPMEFPRIGYNNGLDHEYLILQANSGSTTTFINNDISWADGYREGELTSGGLIVYEGTNADEHLFITDFDDEVITVDELDIAFDNTSKAYIVYPFDPDFKLAVALQVWELYQENPSHSDLISGGVEKLINAGVQSLSTPDGISLSIDMKKYNGKVVINAESMALLDNYAIRNTRILRSARG